jgi:hypothetical protein
METPAARARFRKQFVKTGRDMRFSRACSRSNDCPHINDHEAAGVCGLVCRTRDLWVGLHDCVPRESDGRDFAGRAANPI